MNYLPSFSRPSWFSTKIETLEPVKLPKVIDDFKASFDVNDLELLYLLTNPKKMSKDQALIWKYCGSGLLSGRTMDTTVIVTVGPTGGGKSSLINVLFDDPNLCAINSNESETRNVSLVEKHLVINEESPPVQTTLTMIDLPGMFDTNAKQDVQNIRMMKTFKSSMPEFKDRTNIPAIVRQNCNVPPRVYPNVVLLVVDASENRMGGEDSKMMETLRQLKAFGDLIDYEKVNLIVVFTHVMMLPPVLKIFKQRLAERKKIVREAVKNILGIHNVDIVPVENEASIYKLKKKGDYYVLPTGELSHYNLYEAIKKLLCKNNDLLARLSIAWYYLGNNTDRKKPATVRDLKIETLQEAAGLNSATTARSSAILKYFAAQPKFFNFQHLGYGFCPVIEKVQPMSPLVVSEETERVQIGRKYYQVPKGIECIEKPADRSSSLSFYSKGEYEEHKTNAYGLGAGIRLCVRVSSKGKWVDTGKTSEHNVLLSHLQERQLAVMKIKCIEGHPKSEKFTQQLNALPDVFNNNTKDQFLAFFSVWGTHIIVEIGVGGSIQMVCRLKNASIDQKSFFTAQAAIKAAFDCLKNLGAEAEASQGDDKLRSVGIIENYFEISGGDSPYNHIATSALKGKEMQDWVRSVDDKPIELQYTIKLFPYFNFADGNKAIALRHATEDYLWNILKKQEAEVMFRDLVAKQDLKSVTSFWPSFCFCFPSGTNIYFEGGVTERIENLVDIPGSQRKSILTVGLSGKEEKLKMGAFIKTKFCTYLDAMETETVNYLCLLLENGRKLVVSSHHLIFQFHGENVVRPIQAQYLQLGDRVVYANLEETIEVVPTLEYPAIKNITVERCIGVYCPLTTTGTFFANGVLVSCYANVDSFQVAQMACAPLKLYSNMRPLKRQKGNIEGIHPYAKFLMSVSKAIQPLKLG